MGSIERHPMNPILTRADIPDVFPEIVDATSVFNPGAIRLGDRVVLLLRVQTRGRRTFFLRAESADGLAFSVDPEIVRFDGIEKIEERVHHVYDPRLTRIEDTIYGMVAMDLDADCRLGLARTTDLRSFEFLGVVSGENNRNGVLFPERVGGRYLRLDRPNVVAGGGGMSGDTIALSESEDLLDWRTVGAVMNGRWHYWDEMIGAGPPPIKTREGWLLIYHGIATHLASAFIYQAGAALLDLADPTQVLARTRDNILEPREPYETTGQVPNVVFPSGLIVDEFDNEGFARPRSRVSIYYGAADTSVALATTTVAGLIAACLDESE
jgi:beta-1,4-mannooligosaccharide/beta-1,4-mannosyl-N-acetylglucosamine phosphorylase